MSVAALPTSMPAVPALFLDRDGVVNIDHGYVSRPEDVTFVDGLFAVGRAAHARGLPIVIVTNQAGIGRGYYDEEAFTRLMTWMGQRFEEAGCPLTAVYYCPHHPAAQVPYRRECACRKPGSGMLLAAARDHHLDLDASLLVGDKSSDMTAGAGAGLRRCLLLSEDEPLGTAHRITDLREVLAWLPEHEGATRPGPLRITCACGGGVAP